MVLKIFAALGGLVKVRLVHTDTDSHVFRLHYRLTASICFIACALVAASEYIGDPIQCMNGLKPVSKPVNTYCWIASTFTINTTEKQGHIAGLGNHQGGNVNIKLHAYYQWVSFVLFFQGCFFYLPHLLWKAQEGKLAQNLLQGLDQNSMGDDVAEKRDNIIKYMKASKNRNGRYSVAYYICEALNFVNVLAQIFMLDAFFGGTFMNYGIEVLGYIVEESDDDPFQIVFPKVTKCTYNRIGPSGTIEQKHPLCILPQNILNEKVFVILWFWFVILSTITAMQLVWRLIISLSPVIRVRLLEQRGKMEISPVLEKSIQRLNLGDYFLLEILGKNLDVVTFRDVLMGAILDEDSNANTTYNPLGRPEDDDDPVSMKRRMEASEEGSA